MTESRRGYLGLGSNVGDSAGHLRAAIEGLRERGVEVEAASSVYRTEPVGEILDQPDFLNAALRVRTDLEPESLLRVCKEIEAERGRAFGDPRHSPRPLDIDLLLLGELEFESESLRIPHPQVTSRRFVRPRFSGCGWACRRCGANRAKNSQRPAGTRRPGRVARRLWPASSRTR